MADALDSKSGASDGMRVRVPPPAPFPQLKSGKYAPMNQTSASSDVPASSAAPSNPAPQRYVVNHGFDTLFFISSIAFITISLFGVAVFVLLAVSGELDDIVPNRGSVPDFVENLTGNQYELVVRALGPMDDNLFRCTAAYVLVKTDTDVVSNIEQMAAQDLKFVPLDSPELEDNKEMGWVDDSTARIDDIYQELVKTPPGPECQYFVTRDDPDYSTTYLCYSPETKLLLVVRTKKRWNSDKKKEND